MMPVTMRKPDRPGAAHEQPGDVPMPASSAQASRATGRGIPAFSPSGPLWGLALVVVTFVAYIPALNGKFLWDDDSWTTGIHSLLRDLHGLKLIWSNLTALQQYYPLT